MRDQLGEYAVACGLVPQVETGTNVLTGATIDTGGYLDVDFVVVTGTLSDSNCTVDVALFADTDSAMGTEAEVTGATELLGSADFDYADDIAAFRLGYRGVKRYVRIKVTPSGNSGNIPVAAVAILRKRTAT